jgi:hypothetical protein
MVGGLKPNDVVIDTPWDIGQPCGVLQLRDSSRCHAVYVSGTPHVTVTGFPNHWYTKS